MKWAVHLQLVVLLFIPLASRGNFLFPEGDLIGGLRPSTILDIARAGKSQRQGLKIGFSDQERELALNRSHEEKKRILAGGGDGGEENTFHDIGLSCSLLQVDKKLVCSCKNPTLVLELSEEGKAFQVLLHNNFRTMRSLQFLRCSVHFKTNFFAALGKTLESVLVVDAKDVHFETGSMNFIHQTFQPVNVFILGVEAPLIMEQATFSKEVHNIVLDTVNLYDFGMEPFKNLPPTATISITNSKVLSQGNEEAPFADRNLVRVGQVVFEDSVIDVIQGFIGVTGLESLSFDRCDIELQSMDSLIVNQTRMVAFINSKMELHSDAMNVEAHQFVMDNVTLKEPKQRTLRQVKAYNSSSMATFYNVTLKDPSRGSLYSSFENVDFHNITVDECWCSIEKYLLNDTHDDLGRISPIFTTRIFSMEDRRLLTEQLRNETFCYHTRRKEYIPAREICVSVFPPSVPYVSTEYGVILGILIGGCIIVIILFVIFSQWHIQIKKRSKIIRNIQVLAPRVAHMKTPTITFNNEVEYFPRPPSVFYIDPNFAQAEEDKRKQDGATFQTYQPDLVRSLTDSGNIGLSSLEEETTRRNSGSSVNSVTGPIPAIVEEVEYRPDNEISISRFGKYRATVRQPQTNSIDELSYVEDWPDDDNGEESCDSIIVRNSMNS